MKLRENLKELMDSREENPHSLSNKTGVPQPTIHRILDGTSQDPRRSTLEPLARFFGVTVDELCGIVKSDHRPIPALHQEMLTLLDKLGPEATEALLKAVSLLTKLNQSVVTDTEKPQSDHGVKRHHPSVESHEQGELKIKNARMPRVTVRKRSDKSKMRNEGE
jgi:hypothetical protein